MEEYIIHNSNLISALNSAIDSQRKYEKEKLNYNRDSALVGGWVDLRDNLLKSQKMLIIVK